jgi:hypothetical protein
MADLRVVRLGVDAVESDIQIFQGSKSNALLSNVSWLNFGEA